MSMMPPPSSAGPADEGIPAADAGTGAPEPAPGFGIAGEEPDVAPGEDPQAAGREADDETPFRTPDPREIGPDAQR